MSRRSGMGKGTPRHDWRGAELKGRAEMITPPEGWRVRCDDEDCESFAELCTDEYDSEDVGEINSEEEFEEFIERCGWVVEDGQHYCPECAERRNLK